MDTFLSTSLCLEDNRDQSTFYTALEFAVLFPLAEEGMRIEKRDFFTYGETVIPYTHITGFD